MVKIKYRMEPDVGNAAIYAKKFARYRKVSEALDGLWQNSF